MNKVTAGVLVALVLIYAVYAAIVMHSDKVHGASNGQRVAVEKLSMRYLACGDTGWFCLINEARAEIAAERAGDRP